MSRFIKLNNCLSDTYFRASEIVMLQVYTIPAVENIDAEYSLAIHTRNSSATERYSSREEVEKRVEYILSMA